MGILDDLKNQSNIQKAGEASEAQRQADLIKYYQENLHPKMLQLYTFLNELIENLNYIKLETKASYPIHPDGGLQEFNQADYKVTIDSSREVKEINLRFNCYLEKPLVYEIENSKRVLRYTEVLDNYHIEYERTDNKDNNYDLIGAKFKVIGPVPVNIILKGDIESSSIHLLLNNFEKAGASKHTYKERHVTEEFIDDFGKFILRQNPMFLKLHIKDEHVEKIRKNVQEDLKQRQAEVEEAERLIDQGQNSENDKKSWKNIFKKMD